MRITKPILLIIALLYVSFLATAQQQNKSAAWSHPIFKNIEKKATNLIVFGHDSTDNYFIPIAVLNKTTARLYYINTFGFIFDSLPVGQVLLKELIAKRKDAFQIYTSLVTTEGLSELEEIKGSIRDNKLDLAKLGSKQTYFNYTTLKNTASSFEQLTLLADIEKQVWQNHQLLQLVLADKTDTAFQQKKLSWTFFEPCKIKLHGQKQMDSVEFTACNRFSRIYKAILKPATATIYLLNRQQQAVDSFTVKEDKLKDLTADKQDVFALYRMWLEWQLENAGKQINQLATTKEAKFDIQNLTADQLQRLDTLLRFAYYTERKIRYATLPDKDLLLINLLEQSKKIPRKNWAVAMQQWQEVPMLPVSTTSARLSTFTRGEKEYFLTDHRGNVMATVSDRKIQVDSNNDGIVDYYVADVVTSTDYAPFGSLLAGRTYRNNGQQLKYGYNGKENDNDVKGEGNQQDYGMRINDPRLGRFLSVDPLTKGYPELTPYQFASNTPIQAIDLDGLEQYHYTYSQDAQGTTFLTPMFDGKPQDFEEDKISFGFSGGIFGIFHTYKTVKNPRVQYIVHHQDTKKYYTEPGTLGPETFVYDETRTFSSYEDASKVDESWFVWTTEDAKTSIAAKNKYNEAFLYAAAARSVNSGQKFATTHNVKKQTSAANNGNTQASKPNNILVQHNGVEVPIYRGGGDFKLKSGEYQIKTDRATFPVRGLSLTVDVNKAKGFGGAFKILEIPKELKMIATPSKSDPGHFDIVPTDKQMTESRYQELLKQIKTEEVKQ